MKMNTSMRFILTFLFYTCSFCLPVVMQAQENTYPTEERLFHIERSKNKNLVCYDLNLVDGKPDAKKPLLVYWINREETPGERTELTAIQRKMAYGYKSTAKDDQSFEIELSASPDRKITLKRKGKDYVCLITINNQQCLLRSIYVKAKESNSMSVEYVELRGISLDTKQLQKEQVKK